MGLLAAVAVGFAAAALAPPLLRRLGPAGALLPALVPAGILAFLVTEVPAVARGERPAASVRWVPSLDLAIHLRLDGLGLLFALLVTAVGALVLVYSAGYMAGRPGRARFLGLVLAFMASMLGLVLADDLVLLYVFWELTTISSWLLIGFDHDRPGARKAAWQALMVTAAGGLCLLVALVLVGQATGSFRLPEALARGEALRASGLHLPVLLLVAAAAFTKSAQFPFHFWLPNAMEAPTPASAYLHSATMVKAGIYLLARLSPLLAGGEGWLVLVGGAGAVTMLVGALFAVLETDTKRVLAHTTVSALGTMVLLLGLGGDGAATAALVFLVAHAFYKCALFLVVGALDHGAGSREITELRGLWRAMPFTAAAALLAVLSMTGLPPTLGFLGHEALLEATSGATAAPAAVLTMAATLASVLYVAAALLVGLRPFVGRSIRAPARPHEAPASMWLPTAALAGLGLLGAFFAKDLGRLLVSPAASEILGRPPELELELWHGLTLSLGLGLGSIAAGAALCTALPRARRVAARFEALGRLGPNRLYDALVSGLTALARAQTGLLQHGSLSGYLLVALVATLVLVGTPFLSGPGPALGGWGEAPEPPEVLLGALTVAAAVAAALVGSRVAAVVLLGVVGYTVALLFVVFSAPDLAIAQFLVETLFVVFVVLVLKRLPRFEPVGRRGRRLRDGAVALAVGALVAGLLLAATAEPAEREPARFFAERSQPEAHGRNVVNVILVDFRSLDTLGEITVLGIAAIGVHVLLGLGRRD